MSQLASLSRSGRLICQRLDISVTPVASDTAAWRICAFSRGFGTNFFRKEERRIPVMYKKRPQGWGKHIDFLLLDLAALLFGFSLACKLRQGIWFPLQSALYRNVMILMIPVHFMGTLCLDNHKNILKRGYLKELRSVAEISLFDALTLAFYLFITQTGTEFSRQVFLSFSFITSIVLYRANYMEKAPRFAKIPKRLFYKSSAGRYAQSDCRIGSKANDSKQFRGV